MQRRDLTSSVVLVLAPIGRDSATTVALLQRNGLRAEAVDALPDFVDALRESVGVVVIAEEALFGQPLDALAAWTACQPPWSDLPFVMLTSHHEGRAVRGWRERIGHVLGNVALLERPVQPLTLVSAVDAALRARRRQIEVRDLLRAREEAAHDLELQVALRTAALAAANEELRVQMEERARIEETLRQTQKIEAVGRLTGGLAHDFNNLLMVISGGLNMLEKTEDQARRRRLMEGMRQAADRGAGLTRQLLSFSRKSPLKPVAVDIARQLDGMRELLDRSLRGDVHVLFDFPADLWPVKVDPGELELVVLNLAVNARDAMPHGGTIRVRAENAPRVRERGLTGDFVRLSMSDTGAGMSPEVKAHIFEPFFTTKDVGAGSGLGLAQVHGFAVQSGGAVMVESEEGQGATVTLLLPRSPDPPPPRTLPVPDKSAARPACRSAGSVLLVEDDDEVAELVGEMISHLGYDVTRAAGPAAALGALANGRQIDIVFSDVMMPGGMNGIELAREIRARREGLPVLLTSGYVDANRPAAEAAGLTILPKPFRLDELAAALSETLKLSV